jgi:hypothetical protein
MFTMQGLRDHVGVFNQDTQNENLSKDLFLPGDRYLTEMIALATSAKSRERTRVRGSGTGISATRFRERTQESIFSCY